MSKPFTPRPIYRIKDYRYVVEEGDTPSAIAKRFRQGPGAVRELVAANLYGRVLQPQTLGSPFGFRTFAALEIGESLKIPGHWPDPVGMLAGESEAKLIFDPIFAGIAQQFGAVQAASGGQAVPPELSAAVTNAAAQWWLQTKGGVPAASNAEYAPYVTSAVAWANTFGSQMTPAQAQAFPWAVLLSILPADVDPTTVTWNTQTIPGTPGIRWADLPWSYIGQMGTQLETLKLPPITWPSQVNPLALLGAFQQMVAAATFDAHTCGKNAEKGPGGKCYCQVGYEWASSNPAELDCKPETPTAPPSPPAPQPVPPNPNTPPGSSSACPSGTTWDPAGPAGANCYGCPSGTTYSLATHACAKPTAPVPPSPTPPSPSPPPAPTETKKDNTTLYVIGGLVLAAIGAVTVVAIAKPDMGNMRDKATP